MALLIDVVKEWVANKEFKKKELLSTDKKYIFFHFHFCDTGWYADVEYGDKFDEPYDDDFYNGYDSIWTVDEIREIYKEIRRKKK
jgi:hypothetical protein